MTSDIHKVGTDGGWHGIIKEGGQFPPEKDRYHLYIGLFCPFAHRANLVCHIKGLTDFIGISVVAPYPKGENGYPGWRFPESNDEYPGATVDHLYGSKFLHEIYFKADKEYKGKYSVPVLWDKKAETIVNNESAEILRWLPSSFNNQLSSELAAIDLYPPSLRNSVDEIAPWLQSKLSIGVYKTNAAPDQESYEKSVATVFAALNNLEGLLAKSRGPFILGNTMTEIDIRAFVSIVRFDTVYVQLFLCNLGTIRHDYPLLNNWLKNLYWNVKGFKETTDFRHIKEGYFKSFSNNSKALVPAGPYPDVEEYFEQDWSKLSAGKIMTPLVLEAEKDWPAQS